jgi:oligopeptide transport system substrate-binding protein
MMRLKLWAAAGAMALAFSLAACGGPAADPEDAARTLTRGISANPDTVDPHLASGVWENTIIGDMFIGMFTDDEKAQPVPGMAESWTVSDDGLVWTFKLIDAKWSDGTPVTAYDFEFSMRRILDPATTAQYASLLYVIKNGQAVNAGEMPKEQLGVRAIDEKTFEMTLEYPAPYLPGLLTHYTAFPLPAHVVTEFGDRWTRPENIETNGPYKLVQWRTNDFLEVEKNPFWAGTDDLCFDKVLYFPYADNDAVLRLIRTGKLDMNNDFPGQKYDELMAQMPDWVNTYPYLVITYYVFNADKKPFDDVRVRTGLAMALDRDFMTREVLRVGYEPAYALVPPGIANYQNTAKAAWSDIPRAERLGMARALLEEAGFGPDNPLTFTYTYRSTGDNPKVAPVVQANWREIADWVQPQIQQIDTRVHYANLRAGDFEVGDAGWVADYNDAQNFLYLFESRTGLMNYGRFSNPEYDALVEASNQELDMEKRAAIMAQAEQILMDELPMIPMWFAVSKNLVNPNITGFENNVSDIHRSRYMCRKAE